MSKYAFELQEFLTRIIEEVRTAGLSEEQIVSVFKNAAADFAADTVERVENARAENCQTKKSRKSLRTLMPSSSKRSG